MARKKVLIIPGFGGKTSNGPGPEIIRRCKKFADVYTYNPKWDRSTAAEWIAGARKAVARIGPEDLEVFGFSLGAYVALFLGAEFKLGGVVLCSLSPFFVEQRKDIPASAWKFLGARRRKDFQTRPAPKRLRSKATFLFGSRDWPLGIRTAKKLARRYGSTFSLVEGVGHELTPAYLDKVIGALRKEKPHR
ncbi:MAG TPA: hypothetical protein VJJ47_03965 [Candidatus Paceibacterota bacterium]